MKSKLVLLSLFMFVHLTSGEILDLTGWGMKLKQNSYIFFKDGKCLRFCDQDLVIPSTSVLKIEKPNITSGWN